jgi:uncharacterized protein (DUF305 family)
MQQKKILIGVIAFILGAIGGYSVSELNPEVQTDSTPVSREVPAGMHQMPDGSMMKNSPQTEQVREMTGMDHSAMMVGSEREFVVGMIPHHQEAVDTASEVLARGGSITELTILAEEIIAAQETEIALLKEWHMEWYREPYREDAVYQSMMRDLSQLSGTDLDRRFLEDMIPHHMGAIMMAQSVRPYIEHQEITDMTDAIMTTQSAEIELMQDLLEKI